MKKIAIYGGSFDPPHFGHSFAIWALLNSKLFDEIWVIPSGDRADKPKATDSKHRVAMLSLLLDDTFKEKVFVKDFQINDKNCPSTTYELIKYLEKEDNKYFVVIGAELLAELKTWANYEKLVKELNFVVIPRLNINNKADFLSSVIILDTPKELDFNISSSVIRGLVKDKKSLAGIMSKNIIDYISNNYLYS